MSEKNCYYDFYYKMWLFIYCAEKHEGKRKADKDRDDKREKITKDVKLPMVVPCQLIAIKF